MKFRPWFVCWLALSMIVFTNATAAPCEVDPDCDDGIVCNGVETCGYDSTCRDGFGACAALTQLVGTSVSASSFYTANYVAANTIDGANETGSSWCTAAGDAAPSIAVEWAVNVEISEIRVLTSWSPSYDFLTARFRLLDAAGVGVFDSGVVALNGGEVTLPVAPAASGVRRMEMNGETWRSNAPCLSEIEFDGGLPCATDSDCEFVSPCVAVGVCMPSGTCSAAAPRCRNLSFSRTSVSASSIYRPSYSPSRAIDGVDAVDHSWCAASSDPSPTLSVVLPNEHPVHRISVTNPWAGFDFETARIAIEDALGNSILDSGPVTSDLGEIDLVVDPPASQAHRVTLEGLTFDAGPCVGEFEVLGEYCGIAISDADPPTIFFRPGTPTPNFELRYGQLSELRADGGFDRAACVGRFTSDSVNWTPPDPAPGEGYYLIGRGFNVCADEAFGMSRKVPDPRAALALAPECPP